MKTTEVAEVFGTIRPVLAELVKEAPRVDASFLEQDYPVDEQQEFCEPRILDTLGFEEGSVGSTRPCTRSARRSRRATSA